MKTATFFLLMNLMASLLFGQNSKIDSLNKLISNATSDTARINLEAKKINELSNVNLDTALSFGLKTLQEAKKNNYYRGEVDVRRNINSIYIFKGNFKAAKEQLDYLEQFIKPSKDSSDFGDFYGT